VINDACAWILLAMVLAMVGRQEGGALLAVGGGALMVGVVFLLLKPLFAHLLASPGDGDELPASAFAWILVGVLACAACAEWIGLHAIFGAFLFGVALPRDDRRFRALARRTQPVAMPHFGHRGELNAGRASCSRQAARFAACSFSSSLEALSPHPRSGPR